MKRKLIPFLILPLAALALFAFNPQPDPPGRYHAAFNPQPDPPGRYHSAFNPQPDPPGFI
jgi:hypothetical protein